MKGLSFSEPMVKAWMEGTKSITRRLMNPQPGDGVFCTCEGIRHFYPKAGLPENARVIKPRYLPGETVYIKETWMGTKDCLSYKASDPRQVIEFGYDSWKSPRFMPEIFSRSHALIVSVRPERVQEITEEDAVREGMITDPVVYGDCCHVDTFIRTWESLHPGSWERNDFLWRIELKKQ